MEVKIIIYNFNRSLFINSENIKSIFLTDTIIYYNLLFITDNYFCKTWRKNQL